MAQRRSMLVRALVMLALVPFLDDCTLLFPFRPLSVEPKQEVRLPPPPQAPRFVADPRHDPLVAGGSRYGAALAVGHFSSADSGDPDAELVVGIPGAADDAGAVVIYRKRGAGEQPQRLTPDAFDLDGAVRFGAALAVGDFDADRFDDLAIGAPGPGGGIVVVYGGGGRTDVRRAGDGDALGIALATADFDGDGASDLVVATSSEADGVGDASVVWGAPDAGLTLQAALLEIPAGDRQAGMGFGASLAAGDLERRADRSRPIAPEIAVGAPGFDRLAVGRRDVGRVYVFRLVSRLEGFELSRTIEPHDGWENYAKAFGHALAVGNWNGDHEGAEAFDDLAIGAPQSSIPPDDGQDTTFGQPSGRGRTPGAGLVFIAPHANGGVSSMMRVFEQRRLFGGIDETKDQLGWALAAGDFNADGTSDLAIGSPNERMGGLGASGVKQGGAIYFRFGNEGDWLGEGGIPLVPRACFDYLDAVRGRAFSRKGDRFGAVLLPAYFDDDDAIDLVVGAPDSDVETGTGLASNAGAVWIGLNGETTPGAFEGVFTGPFPDARCGGGDATVTVDVRDREDAVCGLITAEPDLVFDVGGEAVTIPIRSVPVVANTNGAREMALEYVVRDDEGRRVGDLDVTASVVDDQSPMMLDMRFHNRDVDRSCADIELDR